MLDVDASIFLTIASASGTRPLGCTLNVSIRLAKHLFICSSCLQPLPPFSLLWHLPLRCRADASVLSHVSHANVDCHLRAAEQIQMGIATFAKPRMHRSQQVSVHVAPRPVGRVAMDGLKTPQKRSMRAVTVAQQHGSCYGTASHMQLHVLWLVAVVCRSRLRASSGRWRNFLHQYVTCRLRLYMAAFAALAVEKSPCDSGKTKKGGLRHWIKLVHIPSHLQSGLAFFNNKKTRFPTLDGPACMEHMQKQHDFSLFSVTLAKY